MKYFLSKQAKTKKKARKKTLTSNWKLVHRKLKIVFCTHIYGTRTQMVKNKAQGKENESMRNKYDVKEKG